jgi:hypothetical protein
MNKALPWPQRPFGASLVDPSEASSHRDDSVTGPLVQIEAVASENPAIVADNVKIAGHVASTAVSHIAVEFEPCVVAVRVAEVAMNVMAIAFLPTSGSCGWG